MSHKKGLMAALVLSLAAAPMAMAVETPAKLELTKPAQRQIANQLADSVRLITSAHPLSISTMDMPPSISQVFEDFWGDNNPHLFNGVIVGDELLLTVNSEIKNRTVTVQQSGEALIAEVIAQDDIADLALLHVEGLKGEALRPTMSAGLGDETIILSRDNKGGLVANAGIIDAKQEFGKSRGDSQTFYGSEGITSRTPYGAALLNNKGELLGLVSRFGYRGAAQHFVVRLDRLTTLLAEGKTNWQQMQQRKKEIEQLNALQGVTFEKFGITISEYNGELVLSRVEDSTVASMARLEPGDRVLKIDGQEVKTMSEVKKVKILGNTLKIDVARGNTIRFTTLTKNGHKSQCHTVIR